MKIKVTVINENKSGSPFVNTFESMALAQVWIDKYSNHPAEPWGKKEHLEISKEAEYDPETLEELSPAEYLMVPCEFLVQIDDITDQVEAERINRESREYLKATDWYVVRWAETGTPIPTEVQEQRTAARAAVTE